MTLPALLCALVTAAMPLPADASPQVCEAVADAAWSSDVPVTLAVSVAYHESKYTLDRVSTAGAIGPLQVLPRYWCRDEPCDPIAAGMRALRWWLVRADWQTRRAVCAYTGCKVTGNTSFVERIVATTRWLNRAMECQCCPR